jgi:hypothetical protein
MRRRSALANNKKGSRWKTKEEVVQGQGYAHSNLFLNSPGASHTHMNDHQITHTTIPNERNERTSIHDVNQDKR